MSRAGSKGNIHEKDEEVINEDSSSNGKTAMPQFRINEDSFVARELLIKMLKDRSLADLVRSDTLLINEISSLGSSLKSSVFDNYSKFISASNILSSSNTALSTTTNDHVRGLNSLFDKSNVFDFNSFQNKFKKENDDPSISTKNNLENISESILSESDDIISLMVELGGLPDKLKGLTFLISQENFGLMMDNILSQLGGHIMLFKQVLSTTSNEKKGEIDHFSTNLDFFSSEEMKPALISVQLSLIEFSKLAVAIDQQIRTYNKYLISENNENSYPFSIAGLKSKFDDIRNNIHNITPTNNSSKYHLSTGHIHRLYLLLENITNILTKEWSNFLDVETPLNYKDDEFNQLLQETYENVVNCALNNCLNSITNLTITLVKSQIENKNIPRKLLSEWSNNITNYYLEISYAHKTLAILLTRNDISLLTNFKNIDVLSDEWILKCSLYSSYCVSLPIQLWISKNILNESTSIDKLDFSSPLLKLASILLSIEEASTTGSIIYIIETSFLRNERHRPSSTSPNNEYLIDTFLPVEVNEHSSIILLPYIEKLCLKQKAIISRDLIVTSIFNYISRYFLSEWESSSFSNEKNYEKVLNVFINSQLPSIITLLRLIPSVADEIKRSIYMRMPLFKDDSFLLPVRGHLQDVEWSSILADSLLPNRTANTKSYWKTTLLDIVDTLKKTPLSSLVIHAINKALKSCLCPLDIADSSPLSTDIVSRRLYRFIEHTFGKQFLLKHFSITFKSDKPFLALDNLYENICTSCIYNMYNGIIYSELNLPIDKCECGVGFPSSSKILDSCHILNDSKKRTETVMSIDSALESVTAIASPFMAIVINYHMQNIIGKNSPELSIIARFSEKCETFSSWNLRYIGKLTEVTDDETRILRINNLCNLVNSFHSIYYALFSDTNKSQFEDKFNDILHTKKAKELSAACRSVSLSVDKYVSQVSKGILTTDNTCLNAQSNLFKSGLTNGPTIFLDSQFAVWLNSDLCSNTISRSLVYFIDLLCSTISNGIEDYIISEIINVDSNDESESFIIDKSSATSIDISKKFITLVPNLLLKFSNMLNIMDENSIVKAKINLKEKSQFKEEDLHVVTNSGIKGRGMSIVSRGSITDNQPQLSGILQEMSPLSSFSSNTVEQFLGLYRVPKLAISPRYILEIDCGSSSCADTINLEFGRPVLPLNILLSAINDHAENLESGIYGKKNKSEPFSVQTSISNIRHSNRSIYKIPRKFEIISTESPFEVNLGDVEDARLFQSELISGFILECIRHQGISSLILSLIVRQVLLIINTNITEFVSAKNINMNDPNLEDGLCHEVYRRISEYKFLIIYLLIIWPLVIAKKEEIKDSNWIEKVQNGDINNVIYEFSDILIPKDSNEDDLSIGNTIAHCILDDGKEALEVLHPVIDKLWRSSVFVHFIKTELSNIIFWKF